MDYTLLAILVTVAIFFAGVIYKMGRHSSRLEALEKWRDNVRLDMHEISDKLDKLSLQIGNVETLIQERTERRTVPRL